MRKSVMIVLFAISLGVCTGFSQGRQVENKKKNERTEMQSERKKLTAEERADKLAKKLELNQKQKTEVTALLNKHDKEREKIREERKVQAEIQRDKKEANRKNFDSELEQIIGKEKFQQYEKARSDRHKEMNTENARSGKGKHLKHGHRHSGNQ